MALGHNDLTVRNINASLWNIYVTVSFCILIPALNPTHHLLETVKQLAGEESVSRIILVDDGSKAECRSVFQKAREDYGVKIEILRHAVNLGKGAALKTGINHFLCTCTEECVLITADADGQHLTKDILAVARQALLSPDALVLGTRSFRSDVPLRSRFGNSMTRMVFRFFAGCAVPDTQTGLRAIPRALLKRLMVVQANRYEFELEMLLIASRERVTMSFVPIETVYIDGNAESHFNPLLDSMRIYFVFARFLSSSLLTAFIDYTVFSLFFIASANIGFAMAAGRLVAGTVNYTVNRNVVFHSSDSVTASLVKYCLLVLAFGIIAYLIVGWLVECGWNPYAAKIVAEGGMFVLSFLLQRDIVFKPRDSDLSS